MQATEEKTTTPEEQFEQARQAVINRGAEMIATARKNLSENSGEGARYDREYLTMIEQNLIMSYFKFPYLKRYIEWEHKELADTLSPEDVDLISKVLDFDIQHNAVNIFIHSVFDINYLWNDLPNTYRSNPEKAEKPLNEEYENLFNTYLDNIYKPAFLRLMDNIRSGMYREISDITNEFRNAFPHTEDSIPTEEIFKVFGSELQKPNNDLLAYMQEFSKLIGFKKQIRSVIQCINNSHSKNNILVSGNFLKLYNPAEFRAISLANTTTKSGKKTMDKGVLGEISVHSNKKLIRIEKEFEDKFKDFRPSTTRLMITLQAELTANPSKEIVKLSTKEYIAAIGKNPDNETDFYNAMKVIKDDLNSLHLSVSAGALNVELVQATDVNKDYITVLFTDIYKGICCKSAMTTYPKRLINSAYISDTAMYIGRKLSDNYFNDNNAKTGQNKIISIRHILDEVPTLPKPEDVLGRTHKSKIVVPFVRALDDLVCGGILEQWEFCNAKKKPLTDDQCDKQETYSTFIDLYIMYDMVVDEATAASIEARRKRAADKKSAALEKRQAKEAADIVKADRIKKKQKS